MVEEKASRIKLLVFFIYYFHFHLIQLEKEVKIKVYEKVTEQLSKLVLVHVMSQASIQIRSIQIRAISGNNSLINAP